LNIAKTFVKINNQFKAEEFYLKSILSFRTDFGEDYYRLAEVDFDYGLFLQSEGKISEAISAHKKALTICLINYREKHTLVLYLINTLQTITFIKQPWFGFILLSEIPDSCSKKL